MTTDAAALRLQQTTASAVLVHGAWHSTDCWDIVREQLAEQAVESAAVSLPSCGPRPASFSEDVAAVQNELSSMADLGIDIVLVLHSYSGTVGCQVSFPCIYM